MTYRFRNITGSLNALLVFESVARNASFTGAAKEMHLSQPTVSRHIAALEGRLNRPLFVRSGNQVEPTRAAQHLAAAIALGFGHAETAWAEIQQAAQRDEVSIACSFGFAENWLMPRYSSLKKILGRTRLRIATLDTPSRQDLARIDIAVVWDTSPAPERPSFALFSEEAFPVCSPGFLARHPEIVDEADALARADLLHFDVGDSGFLDWRLWFAAQDIEYRPERDTHTYDALPFYTQAILDGEGVGLAWRYLADRSLAEKRLLQVGPGVVNREAAYYLQYREDGPNSAGIGKVVDWFRNAVA